MTPRALHTASRTALRTASTACSARWSALPAGAREFLRELGIVATAGLLYFLVRGAVQDRAEEAFARARALLDLEHQLGIAWEAAIHEAALSAAWIVDFANAIYFWGHMPLLIALALWLWFRHRPVWRGLRAALLASALLGIACYVIWPTAPPRLMPELGYVDTLAWRAAASYQAQEVGPFVNPYAALPSLHVGWALLAGTACVRVALVQRGARRAAWLALAALIPASQIWAVVATANHWLLDAAAGAAVVALAALLASLSAYAVARLRRTLVRGAPRPAAAQWLWRSSNADRHDAVGAGPRDR